MLRQPEIYWIVDKEDVRDERRQNVDETVTDHQLDAPTILHQVVDGFKELTKQNLKLLLSSIVIQPARES